MNFKNVLPLEVNFKIKNFVKKHNNIIKEWNEDNSKKYVYFLDAPEYGNIGDQAIAFAMEKFMGDFFPDYIQREILENDIYSYLKYLKSIIKPKDIICLTGGGNMGVLYQRYEAIRRLIIKNFTDNLIIIFPQTIDYGESRYGKREFQRACKVYNSHRKLIIMAREEKTYDIMKDNFINCKVILCPDIVLYLDYKDIVKDKKNRIGVCLRNDKEKKVSNIELGMLNQISDEIVEISTTCNLSYDITYKNREDIVMQKLEEIATNKYFITDRLHGMIFAYITNTSCIALPNSNGKVERVYNWIKNKGNVKFENKFDGEFIDQKGDNKHLTEEFNVIVDEVKLFLNGDCDNGKN